MSQSRTRNRRQYITSRLRLRDYDYSTPAYYFVSICCEKRASRFGKVEDRRMILNPAGNMIDRLWNELPIEFQGVTLDRHVTMPNHIHALIGIGVKASDPLDLTSLIDVIHWYKSLSTTRYIQGVKRSGWARFEGRLWQERFHDHIVRNETELHRIREYIENNPRLWDEDTYYSG